MSGQPPLPDLATLSNEQKDQLIVSLWQTVLALDGTREAPAGTTGERPGVAELQARIGATAASRRVSTPRRRGSARG